MGGAPFRFLEGSIMSDAPRPPSAKATPSLGVIIGLAALAGAAVAGAFVYAKAPSGDNLAQTANRCSGLEAQATAAADFAKGDVAAMGAAEPKPMDAIAFMDAAGAPKTLADFKGKTVLLNLWATWCAPCREEMPALDALQAAKGGDDFEVVALNLDRGTDSKPQDFYAETGIKDLALYRDGTLKSFNDLKGQGLVLGLPVTMLINADGCLLSVMNGPAHWSGPDALAFVDGVLARP
jgi:thiol-disulfide isomerase/thioredoxin